MAIQIQGGPAMNVVVASNVQAEGGSAIPVAVVADGRAQSAGKATRVVVVTNPDHIEGGPAIPVVLSSDPAIEGGPAIRVYVVQGSLSPTPAFTPSQLSGLAVWLKADAITGKNDGDAIATWNDSSGNGVNATQGTGANQPIYRTAIQNGLPILRFNGTSQRFAITPPAIAGGITIFAVTIVALPGGTQYITDFNNPGTYLFSLTLDTTNESAIGYDGGFKSATTTIAAGAHTWGLRSTQNSVITAYKDGVASLTAAIGAYGSPSGSAAQIGAIRGGASSFLSGDMGEFLVYNRALNDTEIAQLQAYLKAKWATP